MEELFIGSNGQSIGTQTIIAALKDVGAADAEAVFLHSDIMFGNPGADFSRKRVLSCIEEALYQAGVKNIIVPTFTYSFCNGEDYDINNSKTSMGVLNEHLRKHPDRYRTSDPILSLSVPRKYDAHFKRYEGSHSLGCGGSLDGVRGLGGVKFLFLGADLAECFTYVHYVEKILNVPYKFDMPFSGVITHGNGSTEKRTQYIHTQCKGAVLPRRYDYFEKELIEKGLLKQVKLGDKYVSCIDEDIAFNAIKNHITKDINYFLEVPYSECMLTREYTYSREAGRITHC